MFETKEKENRAKKVVGINILKFTKRFTTQLVSTF